MKTSLIVLAALFAAISISSTFANAAGVNIEAEGKVLLQGVQDGLNSASALTISDEALAKPLFDSLVGSRVKVTTDTQQRPNLVVATRRTGRNLGCTRIEFFTIGGSKTNYNCSIAFDANGKAFIQK